MARAWLRGLRIDCQREHGFETAELYGTLDLGGHGVTAFGTLGCGFRDGFEHSAERWSIRDSHVVLDES